MQPCSTSAGSSARRRGGQCAGEVTCTGPARLQQPGPGSTERRTRQISSASLCAPMVIELAGLMLEASLLLCLASCLASKLSYLFCCYCLPRKPQHCFAYCSAIQCLAPSGYQMQDNFFFLILGKHKPSFPTSRELLY